MYHIMTFCIYTLTGHFIWYTLLVPVSWHFILPVRFSYLSLLGMRTSILDPFSYAEQQYLMYLHYCKHRFRVEVGVDLIKHNLIGRNKYLLLVSGTRCIPSIHNGKYNT